MSNAIGTSNQLLVIVGSIVIMGVSLGITIGYISIKDWIRLFFMGLLF